MHLWIKTYFVPRTIDNNKNPFKLPTAYNAPGQKNISDEDDKEKIHIDNRTGNVDDYTLEQLQDVVNGWMRYIRKFLKVNKDMVIVLTVQIYRRVYIYFLILR